MKRCQRHEPESHPYCVECANEAYAEYRHRAQAGETTEDDVEIWGHGEDSESDCEDDETADETSGRRAYNTLLYDL